MGYRVLMGWQGRRNGDVPRTQAGHGRCWAGWGWGQRLRPPAGTPEEGNWDGADPEQELQPGETLQRPCQNW